MAANQQYEEGKTITIRAPDDFHVHLRSGPLLSVTSVSSFSVFSRCLVMPNLHTPVATAAQADEYRTQIMDSMPEHLKRTANPIMSLYLTPNTLISDIDNCASFPFIRALKLYPAGATTHSQQGINLTQLDKYLPIFHRMSDLGLLLLIHGELPDVDVDFFHRERAFVDGPLGALVKACPKLNIVLEHITTKRAVDFVLAAPATVAATVTVQHLLLNRNSLFEGGLNPHNYCLPILKKEEDRQALLAAVTSGNPKFFAGTDSAPHIRSRKESCCGCAGCFTAPAAMELYAQIFEEAGEMDKLENFTSVFGAQFYGLPLNSGSLTLVRSSWSIPSEVSVPGGDGPIVPFQAGRTVKWRVKGRQYGEENTEEKK